MQHQESRGASVQWTMTAKTPPSSPTHTHIGRIRQIDAKCVTVCPAYTHSQGSMLEQMCANFRAATKHRHQQLYLWWRCVHVCVCVWITEMPAATLKPTGQQYLTRLPYNVWIRVNPWPLRDDSLRMESMGAGDGGGWADVVGRD